MFLGVNGLNLKVRGLLLGTRLTYPQETRVSSPLKAPVVVLTRGQWGWGVVTSSAIWQPQEKAQLWPASKRHLTVTFRGLGLRT